MRLSAWCLTLVLFGVQPAWALKTTAPVLFHGIALTDDAVIVSYAGDLWSIALGGGAAKRITRTDYREQFPIISPDGRRVAFTADESGDADAFVLELKAGAKPSQWTHHPKNDRALAWSPDGTRILFATSRFGDGIIRFCTTGENDPLPELVPLPLAFQGAFAPDGDHLVYAPVGWHQDSSPYRYYRGGMTSPMWITDLRDGSVEVVYGNDANHDHFVWVDDTIYFTSDETGTYNVYAHNRTTGSARQLTNFDDYGVDALSVRGATAAYIQAGAIHVLDLSRGDSRVLETAFEVDAPEREPREIEARKQLTFAHASEDGKTIAITARGDVFLYREDGSPLNITQSPGVAERDATLSPDGKRVAYFTDASGEYRLAVRHADDKGDVTFIDIEPSPTFYRQLKWSPDGRWIAFTGKRLGLWLADTQSNSVQRIDASNYLAQDLFHPDWSSDSRYLAYERGKPNHQHDVVIFDTEQAKRHTVTSDIDAIRPVFDRNGKYLYYIASDNSPLASANQVWGLLSSLQAGPLVTRSVHAVVLRNDQPAPYLPSSPRPNEAADMGSAAAQFRIDWPGIEDRIVKMPTPDRDYVDLAAGSNGVVYLTARNWPEAPGASGGGSPAVYRVDFAGRPTLGDEAFTSPEFQCIDGGKGALLQRGSTLLLQVDSESEPEKLAFGDLVTTIDPVAEWAQMYHEAWRMMRDYFYESGHHGQDLVKLEADYAAYLPGITSRSELNILFRKMLGHISISHMSIGGGDTTSTRTRSPRIGLLGADMEVANGRFRLVKIYRRAPAYDPSSLALAAPLDQPGIDIHEGDYVIKLNDNELDVTRNLYSQLKGLANKPTKITVSATPDGSASREYSIVPLSGTNGLRRANWDMEKRARVDELSDGTIGYITITQFGFEQINGFIRQFVAASDKAGLVIDQRFNGGGITSDTLVHMLLQQPLHAYDYPNGDDFTVSPVRHLGPKVLITNEQNFSAAETFPLMFKIAEAGTIVGMRTGGGGTGGALHYPDLIDGGSITIPNRAGYNPRTGEWAENSGVSPDVEVQWMPEDFRAGRDPQLERAVAIAMERAKSEPVYVPKRPEYMKQP